MREVNQDTMKMSMMKLMQTKEAMIEVVKIKGGNKTAGEILIKNYADNGDDDDGGGGDSEIRSQAVRIKV